MTKPNLNLFSATLRRPAPRVAQTRRRGSALVLAIVTIVMMVMLGAAYLQMARIDRRTAAAVDTRANADEASILRYIGNLLQGDVPVKLDGVTEFYDYPWTATATNPGSLTSAASLDVASRRTALVWLVEDRFAPTVVPGPVPDFDEGDLPAREPRAGFAVADFAGHYYAEGNHGDDPWLASSEPYDLAYPTVTLRGYWPHLTNLMGVYLDLGNLVTDPVSSSGLYPLQYLSTADNNPDSGNVDALLAVLTTSGAVDPFKFADADGDGIYDSRWTWAPLPSDGGLAYVMAVRIIDNSALIDLNTWSYSRADDLANEPSRWLWPGELDLDSALTMVRTNAGVGSLDAPAMLGVGARGLTANGGLGTRTFYDRMYNWLDASAVWKRINKAKDLDDWQYLGTDLEQKQQASGTGVPGGETTNMPVANADYERFRPRQNELELRWRFGLNRALADNSAAETSTDIELLDSALFRVNDLETAWDDTPYVPLEPAFMFDEPRKLLSTVTGSADYARVDINEAAQFDSNNVNDSDDLNDLAEVFEDSLPTVPALYVLGGWANENEFASQAAAVVRDFIDKDARLTYRETDGGDGMYGMEFLPFISEVYLQARYTADVRLASPTPPTIPTASGEDEVRWTHNAGDYAAAIELINPWPWTIEMPEVELFVGGQSWGMLQDLLGGQATMTANEFVILRRRDTGGDNSRIDAITGADNVPDPAILDWPIDATTADEVEIRLEAETNTPRAVVYQRFFVNDIASAVTDRYTDGTVVATGIADGDDGYRQYTFLGTGNGINAIAVRDVDVEAIEYDVPDNTDLLTPNNEIVENTPQPIDSAPTDHSKFNTALKGATSPDPDNTLIAAAEDLDTRVQDAADVAAAASGDEPWIIGNAGRMYRTGDILRTVFLGPRRNGATDVSVADVWKTFYDSTVGGTEQYAIANLMLNLQDPATAAGTGMPHAAFYLTSFTTLGVNDGKGGLVAGRPNINTMPRRILENILPTDSVASAQAITDFIVASREDPNLVTTLNLGGATKGIPYVAELGKSAEVYEPTATAGTGPFTQVIDFNELDPGVGPDYAAAPAPKDDGFTQDLEEQTMMLSYLNQVVSTRSDIYTAYVLVRAYPSDDFSNGGLNTPADEFRLIAVFDRSEPGFPKILSVKRFADAP